MDVDETEEQAANDRKAAASASASSSTNVTLHSGLSPSLSSTLSLSPAPPPSLRDRSLAKFKSNDESMLAAGKRALASAAKRPALKNRCADPKGCVSRGGCSCTKRVSEAPPTSVSAVVVAAISTSVSSSAAALASASSQSAVSSSKRIRFAAKPEELLRAAVFSPRITSPSPFNPTKAERGKKKREWRRAQQENREEADEALETAAAADKPALLALYRETDRRIDEAFRNAVRQEEITEKSADHRAAREEAAQKPRAGDNDDDEEEDEDGEDDEDEDDDEVVITQAKVESGSNSTRVNADLVAISRTAHHPSSPPSAAPRSPITQPKRTEAQLPRNEKALAATSSTPLKQQHAPQSQAPPRPAARPTAPASSHTHSLSSLMLQQKQKQKQEADEAEQTRTVSQLKTEYCVEGATLSRPRTREQPAAVQPSRAPAAVQPARAPASVQPARAPTAAAATAAAAAQPKQPQQQPTLQQQPQQPFPPQRAPFTPPREQFRSLRDVDEVDRSRKRKEPASSLLRALNETTPFIASGSILTSAFNSGSSAGVRNKKSRKPGVIGPLPLTNATAARKKAAQEAKSAGHAAVHPRQPRRTVTQSTASLPRGLPPAAPPPAAAAPFSAGLNASANRSASSSAYPPLNRTAAVLDLRAPASPQINLISPDVGARSMEMESTPLQTATAAAPRSSIIAPPPRVANAFAAPAVTGPFLQMAGGAVGGAGAAASALPPLTPLVAPMNVQPVTPSSPPPEYRAHVFCDTATGRYCCDKCSTPFDPRCWYRHMVAHFKSKHPQLFDEIAPLESHEMKKQRLRGPTVGVTLAAAGAATTVYSFPMPPLPVIHPPGTTPMDAPLAAPMVPPVAMLGSIPHLPAMQQPQPTAFHGPSAGGPIRASNSMPPPLLPQIPLAAPPAAAPPPPLARPPPLPPRRVSSSPPIAFVLPPRAAPKASAAAPVPLISRPNFLPTGTDFVPENLRGLVTRDRSSYRCVHCELTFEIGVRAAAVHSHHAKMHATPRNIAPRFSLRQHM